ncbi:SEC-C domain-containing protein [Salipaludibacillus sp. CUR1]|uniref:SEC-C metal-binding domain-containing protein n=1 Tax=Salipaludibacillus sp. CUR1 TaxID=2820003 RepID=UPI001E30354B|nr:SEC-C metal-binding domain-containing protein [Salipaludibacillus sp. CUR1]MCE7791527.1 SEC-C domain-containing protein [Salipaludibacillus sp. CUR1]
MIGAVFINDFYYMVQAGELFDSEGYMAKLEKLPDYYFELVEGEEDIEIENLYEENDNYLPPNDAIDLVKDMEADDFRQEPVRSEKIGRNEPCPCESGKKYKKCCGKGA